MTKEEQDALNLELKISSSNGYDGVDGVKSLIKRGADVNSQPK